ncbi:uncharacterized protein LOC128681115 isoform X2 [Plodia interpunctella]|uniref:uncharacterized protein LOC128681115 isoform X2 n=1 Tax=Plodia interpunctella TaxID=58824 RepID=UPI00236835A6|nr:uncharacterized protein LOC128681115 isoform X2 [Plodia interpunctella]
MGIRWYRSRRNQIVIILLILGLLVYSALRDKTEVLDFDMTKRNSISAYIDRKLEEQLKLDKGTGCEMPVLDPFAKEVTQFDKKMPKVVCASVDWVKCYFSECRVVKEILDKYVNVSCVYTDIVYINDDHYEYGKPVLVRDADVYHLKRSDHAKVTCSGGTNSFLHFLNKWNGYVAGFRSTVSEPRKSSSGDEVPKEDKNRPTNILIFGFDSTARNGFIRRMPKSYRYLTEQLHAVVLKGYNILGDGTPASLFPILTGKNELELPDARRKAGNQKTVSDMPFIFLKLKKEGYRTLYFEDMPWVGTFQYRFNGFRSQPADHYLRAFYLDESYSNKKRWLTNKTTYCIGETPQYKLMMNLTNQFFHLDGKKYAFTFIADISHDDFNMISVADDDFVDFLKSFKNDGFLKDTLLFVMGDHGPRYAKIRNTYQGKLEERLPLMAIVLPSTLKSQRPQALDNLRQNVDVLTTPHDIYATVLDAMDLRKYWNPYKIKGADLPRAMTLFEPIPRNRSCSEAGIEPHWCACLSWKPVPTSDPLRSRAAEALVQYINDMTAPVRSKCLPRTLTSVSWVMKQHADSSMLSFEGARDNDGYVGKFGNKIKLKTETYQVMLTVGPGTGDFEASMTYDVDRGGFKIDRRDISRTNMYGHEPDCISKTHPHLNPYCYCTG